MKIFSKERFSKRSIIIIIVALLVLAFFLFSNSGLIKRLALEKQKHNLIDKINNEKKSEDSLKKEIYLMEHDKTEIERIAREKYGMIKPGEKVYMMKDKK